MLTCRLPSTAAAIILYIMWWKPPMPSLSRTLWYREQVNVARQLDFCCIFILKFNPLATFKKRWINDNKRKSILFPCLKSFLAHNNSGGLNVTLPSQVVVYSPARRAEKPLLFLLYPSLLCGWGGTEDGWVLYREPRARICIRLRSPGISSQASIPPA